MQDSEIDEEFDEFFDVVDGIVCPECGGSGLSWEGRDCEFCDGDGRI